LRDVEFSLCDSVSDVALINFIESRRRALPGVRRLASLRAMFQGRSRPSRFGPQLESLRQSGLEISVRYGREYL
jgi:hypothetical protein